MPTKTKILIAKVIIIEYKRKMLWNKTYGDIPA